MVYLKVCGRATLSFLAMVAVVQLGVFIEDTWGGNWVVAYISLVIVNVCCCIIWYLDNECE